MGTCTQKSWKQNKKTATPRITMRPLLFPWKINSWGTFSLYQWITRSMEALRGILSTAWHRGTIVTPPLRLTCTYCCASTSTKYPRTRISWRQHVASRPKVCYSTSAPLHLMGRQLQVQTPLLKTLLLAGNTGIAGTDSHCVQTPTKRLPRYVIHVFTIHAPLVYINICSLYFATYWHWI